MAVLLIRIRDPEYVFSRSGIGFLGIRKRFFWIPDHGSKTHIIQSLLTTFWEKKVYNSMKIHPKFSIL